MSMLPIKSTTNTRKPLLATDDVELLDDLLRLAAAAQVEPDIAASLPAVRARWSAASVVVAGPDALDGLERSHVPRRAGLVLVARDEHGDSDHPSRLWQRAVELGAERVVLIPSGEAWIVDRFAAEADAGTALAPVVCVVGARGGAGASTLTAALAVTAATTGLAARAVDLDALGPGLDVVLGSEVREGLRWSDMARAKGRVPAKVMDSGLPEVAGVRVLTWGAGPTERLWPGSVAAALDALTKSGDAVFVDLPRDLAEPVGEAIARATHVLVVVPQDVCSVAGAARVIGSPMLDGADLRLVTRFPSPGGMSASEIAEMLAVPVIATVHRDRALAADLEFGVAPGQRARSPLARASHQILRELRELAGVR